MIPHEAESADEWFTPGRFAAVLAGFIVLTFPGIVFGQETFFYRDFGIFGYPLAHYQREAFWRGELPLWNPLNNCGMPFLAQWNTLTLYPPALFYLVFPLSWSLAVFNLGHLFLAGMGMYFLAHRATGNRLAAAVAGVAFAFNGLTWGALLWPNDISGLGWMPWVVLTTERAWREGGRRIVVAALAGAMQMLTGAPEVILLTWLVVGVFWLAQLLTRKVPRRRAIGAMAAVVLAVGGLAAAQLLPFIDLLAHSHRDAGDAITAGWAMPGYGLADFLAPLFHCFPSSHGVFMQYDQFWVSSYYLGVAPVALAVVGAWEDRNQRVRLLLAVAVISVMIALGNNGYLYPWLRAVLPQLGFIRYPIKFVVVAVLAIPMLSAFGVSWHRRAAGISTRNFKTLQTVTLILLALIALIVWAAWKYPRPKDDWPATWHDAAVRAGFLVLTAGTLLSLNRVGKLKLQLLLRFGLLLLLWLDVYTHAPNLTPTVNRSVYEPGLVRQVLKLPVKARAGEPRFMESQAAIEKMEFTALADPAQEYLGRRMALFDDCNLLDAASKINGFYSLYLADTVRVTDLLYSNDWRKVDLKGLKDFLGVAYINPPQTSDEKALEWMPRATFLPLITGGQEPIFADRQEALSRLGSTDFDPRQTVYLAPEARTFVSARRAPVKILSQEMETHRLKAEVAAEAPAVVVVAQSFYSAWHAYVDGRRVKLWQANCAFQALEVPPGRHVVTLVYEDLMFKCGVIVSLGTLCGLGSVGFLCRRG